MGDGGIITIPENIQPMQFTPNINEHIHRWAPYVQGFSASFVQSILDRYKKEYPDPVVLDPFAGCGTVFKIKNWSTALVINDGRPATQSDFNVAVVRKALELYLIKLFKANKYAVVAQEEPQKLNALQKFLVNSLREELNFFLLKKNVAN